MTNIDETTVVMISIDRLGEYLRQAAAEGIRIGLNNTAGAWTDYGIAHKVMVNNNILPIVDKTTDALPEKKSTQFPFVGPIS